MDTVKCLKCGSTEMMFPVETHTTYDTIGGLQLKLKEPKDPQVWMQLRDQLLMPVKARVCGSCGFVELYAENPATLQKYWQRGYR